MDKYMIYVRFGIKTPTTTKELIIVVKKKLIDTLKDKINKINILIFS